MSARQHGMNRMTQFMCEGGNVARPSFIIDHDPRSQIRQWRVTKRPAAFPVPRSRVEVLFIKHALGEFRNLG
jgi:hypothetical protein